MMPTEHVLSHDDFVDLARGGGPPATIRRLGAGQRSLRVAALLFAARRSARAAEAVEVISEVQRVSPSVGESLLDHPFLGPWSAQGADPHYLVGLAVGGALRVGLDTELYPSSGRLVVPGLGVLTEPSVGDPKWELLRRAEAPFDVVIDDLDPYRDCFGRPAAKRLSPEAARRIIGVIGEAWDYLTTALPEYAPTVAATVNTLVPLAGVEGSDVSASSRRAFGAVGMHVPDDPRLLALLLVHEHMHVKLGALMDLVALVKPGGEPRYVAPWRPDRRPAAALLQGVYAHRAVTDFWRAAACLQPDWRVAAGEAERWAARTATALNTLATCGELTGPGEAFVEMLRSAA